jgi:hypothetical protein
LKLRTFCLTGLVPFLFGNTESHQNAFDTANWMARTERLLDKSLGIVTGMLKLSKLPLMRPLRRIAIELLEAVSEDTTETAKLSP